MTQTQTDWVDSDHDESERRSTLSDTSLDPELQSALDTAKTECKDPYCQSYLSALDQAQAEAGLHGVGVQLLYILNNMQGWRGPLARQTKLTLKKWAKKLSEHST